MKAKALVLGASGFLGSHVTKELVKQGYNVRIFTRPTSNTETTDHLNVICSTWLPELQGQSRQR